MKFKYLPKDRMSKLPKSPGVYAFKSKKQFLYIGKAVNLLNRVNSHNEDFARGRDKHIAYIETKSEDEALLLEAKLIKKYQPKYNVDWKDDKNYFYVGITRETFPRIFVTHQFENRSRTDYIGPFTNGKALKQSLRALRKIHPYRTCKTLPKKPCLWFHLNQCPAPCIFSGQHLEAYDISNIQGKEATGAMVTFINGKHDKNFYRRFKIKTVNKANDVAMLKEVLSRRLKHKEWPYPDLMLIDGGKAQLNAAILETKKYKTLPAGRQVKTKLMALAKKNNELYIEWQKKPILLKNLPQEFYNLILRARDEAHRFARAYHHILRDKNLLT
ncbi:MAG: GIY-YIG nuclease family protein [Candidatus Nealsonbacteria bacterium]|nr:GIY-YIG nuclease family protein [Candidatus Nealsonbacteria bacterium]